MSCEIKKIGIQIPANLWLEISALAASEGRKKSPFVCALISYGLIEHKRSRSRRKPRAIAPLPKP